MSSSYLSLLKISSVNNMEKNELIQFKSIRKGAHNCSANVTRLAGKSYWVASKYYQNIKDSLIQC